MTIGCYESRQAGSARRKVMGKKERGNVQRSVAEREGSHRRRPAVGAADRRADSHGQGQAASQTGKRVGGQAGEDLDRWIRARSSRPIPSHRACRGFLRRGFPSGAGFARSRGGASRVAARRRSPPCAATPPWLPVSAFPCRFCGFAAVLSRRGCGCSRRTARALVGVLSCRSNLGGGSCVLIVCWSAGRSRLPRACAKGATGCRGGCRSGWAPASSFTRRCSPSATLPSAPSALCSSPCFLGLLCTRVGGGVPRHAVARCLWVAPRFTAARLAFTAGCTAPSAPYQIVVPTCLPCPLRRTAPSGSRQCAAVPPAPVSPTGPAAQVAAGASPLIIRSGNRRTRLTDSSSVPSRFSRSSGGHCGSARTARSPSWMSRSTAKNMWSRAG